MGQTADLEEARSRFDCQAANFDERAGVPEEAARSVAHELRRLASFTFGGLVVDIGAGTGTVGRYVAGPAVRYLGLDLSLPMLHVFAAKMQQAKQSQLSTLLVRADANRTWPLAPGSAAVVFFSRSLHLLVPEHVTSESVRVVSSKKAFIAAGRVRRSPGGARALLRENLLSRLADRAIIGNRGEEALRRVMVELQGRGRRIVEVDRLVVARWTRQETWHQSLDAWRRQPGLAGVPVEAAVKETILGELAGWAKERFGPLDAVTVSDEQYELDLIEIDAKPSA